MKPKKELIHLPINCKHMKKLLAFILICLSAAEGKAQLSKAETISYLNSRLAETRDLSITWGKISYTISNTVFAMSTKYKNKITFSFDRKFSDGGSDRLVRTFDPTHIVDVVPGEVIPNDAVGFVRINLIGETFISWQKTTGLPERYTYQNYFTFPFLIADRINLERVSKALLHLKKLYIESKPRDPFLN